MTEPIRNGPTNGEHDHKKWRVRKEQILLYFGLGMFAAEFINAEVRGGAFHFEFLIGALALCGISVTSWLDRRL